VARRRLILLLGFALLGLLLVGQWMRIQTLEQQIAGLESLLWPPLAWHPDRDLDSWPPLDWDRKGNQDGPHPLDSARSERGEMFYKKDGRTYPVTPLEHGQNSKIRR